MICTYAYRGYMLCLMSSLKKKPHALADLLQMTNLDAQG